jgi:hypothetical protein
MNCINTSSPEYIKLLNESKFKPEILKAKVSMWQEANGFDSFPTLTDLGINPSTVNSAMKALDLLTTDKAEKLFNTLNKNKVVDNIFWNKVQQDLGIPKEQVEILKSFNSKDRNKLITDLLANYSYTIEINTAKDKGIKDAFGNIWVDEYPNKKIGDFITIDNQQWEILGTRLEDDSWGKSGLDERKAFIVGQKEGKPTQHYSNLTVPGGTNYTEQEIATPAITPSIKGHAQFATDKGIGWFRSDVRIGGEKNSRTWTKDINNNEVELPQEGTVRRILELQSDLFQKGRSNEYLISNLEATIDELGPYSPKDMVNSNQFLQLLNKDSNWVTFFVKSIIQDSAKKGYEKVLFPSGNTASKIEGHTTLEEFKKQKEDRIKELETEYNSIPNTILYTVSEEAPFGLEPLSSKKEVKDILENNLTKEEIKSLGVKIVENDSNIVTRALINNEINQLKQELERVEAEGFGALKPIYNFYENTVTNILKKQGYNPVLITDEYGNTWNELNIKETDVAPIYYQLGGKLSPAQQEAKDLYFDRVYNKDLSDLEIYQINKKLESISSQTGDVPWKLRKSTKGNWYIAGYKNKPVTMSDYYSPYGGEFRQIESKGTPNEALDNLIKIFITKAGFDIKVFDEIKTRTGDNAVAAVDLFNRLVKIAKNKAGKDTLTEEASHILVEMLGDNHPLVIKMMDNIENTEVYQPTYDEYFDVYQGNVNKIKKEAVGKMITKIALQKFEKNEFNTTPETTWNKFVKLVQAVFTWLENKFKKVPDTFESEIDKLYGEASKMLLEGDASQLQESEFNTINSIISLIPEIISVKKEKLPLGIGGRFKTGGNIPIGKGEIVLNENNSDQENKESLAHELVHGILQLRYNEKLSANPKIEHKNIGSKYEHFYASYSSYGARLGKRFNTKQEAQEYIKNAKSQTVNFKGSELEKELKSIWKEIPKKGINPILIDYINKNVEELVTYTLTNKDFAKALNKIEYQGEILEYQGKSIFQVIIDLFSKIIPVKGSAYDKVLSVLNNYSQNVNLDIQSTEEFYQLDTDKKNKVDAVTEQIRRTKAQILRVKKQNPNWAKNVKISAFITKLEQYIKQLEEEKSVGIIEDKATRELAAIDAKIKDFNSIKEEDKEEFFSYSMDVIKGWKDLSEFINYEDVVLQAKINELQGKALALENKLVEVYQKWVETQDNVDMTSPIEDVSFFGANLLDIAQSNIPALQKIQEIINKALFKGYELYSQLDKKVDSEFDKLKKWADSQGKSNKELWDIFRQKDSKGNWTGNYVVETSQAYYEEKKRQRELADKSGSDKNLKAWLRANTVKTFDKEAYDAAYNQAVLEFTNNGIIDEVGLNAWVKANDENSYKSPFAEYSPNKDLWADKQYQYIQSVPELKAFYDFFINTLEERKQPLPKYFNAQSNYLPELKKGMFKDFAQNGMTGIATEWGKRMKDLFTTDVEGTMETLLRDPITGKPEKTIPVYMMSNTLDTNQKEYDLTKVLKAFGAMSYAYEQKSIVEEPIKLRTSLFRQLKEKLVAEGTEKRDRFGKLVEIFDGNKNALDLMEYYVDATLYGQTRFEDKSLTVAKTDEGKKKVTLTTILDQMINYTRLKGLSFNIFAGVTNSIFGISSNFIYAEGKKDFTPKQAEIAFEIMLLSLIKGSESNKKVKFLMDKFRIKPDYISAEGDEGTLGKYAFFMTEAGEYLNYGQSGIATLLNTEIKNLKGESKSLYDAYIVKDGKTVWNTKEFGPEQYEDLSEEKYNLYSKIQELNKKIHGNYDPDSPTRAKAHVVGRALLIFRTWLPMAIHSRFGSQTYSKALGRDVKGRYLSGWDYLKENKIKGLIPVGQELITQVLNTMTFNRLELESGAFENLSELDRENMLRNVAEIRFILFFMTLGMLLRGMTLEDDDEERVAMYKFLINQSDRVGGELKFFFSPADQSRIIRDISPVSKTVADFYDLVPASFKFIMGEDEIKGGPNKGKSNLARQLKQAVPVITQIQKVEELADRNIDNPMFR